MVLAQSSHMDLPPPCTPGLSSPVHTLASQCWFSIHTSCVTGTRHTSSNSRCQGQLTLHRFYVIFMALVGGRCYCAHFLDEAQSG